MIQYIETLISKGLSEKKEKIKFIENPKKELIFRLYLLQ